MCEPLAARGARMLGVAAAAKNIAAARLHADAGRPDIDYRIGEPRAALRDGECFDVRLLLEVVEHVDNMHRFMDEAVQHLKPGGLLLASTINRTARSFATAVVGAELVFRVLSRGTHQWARFVRPVELEQAAQAGGLRMHHRRGMRYVPVVHRASWTRDLSVNYIASFNREVAEKGSTR